MDFATETMTEAPNKSLEGTLSVANSVSHSIGHHWFLALQLQ